jgi:hypothetical protein
MTQPHLHRLLDLEVPFQRVEQSAAAVDPPAPLTHEQHHVALAAGTLTSGTRTEIGRLRMSDLQSDCSYRYAKEQEEEEKEENQIG